jgi:hypothetical protein
MLHEWTYEAQARFLREVERGGHSRLIGSAACRLQPDSRRSLVPVQVEKMEPPPLPRSIVLHGAELVKLYSAFFRTPHFRSWWQRRRGDVLGASAAPAAAAEEERSQRLGEPPAWRRLGEL